MEDGVTSDDVPPAVQECSSGTAHYRSFQLVRALSSHSVPHVEAFVPHSLVYPDSEDNVSKGYVLVCLVHSAREVLQPKRDGEDDVQGGLLKVDGHGQREVDCDGLEGGRQLGRLRPDADVCETRAGRAASCEERASLSSVCE